MKIFNYHKETKEYLNTSIARSDPKVEGKFSMPANSTKAIPPTIPVNKAAIFNGLGWDLVNDYRGTRYWLLNNFGLEIKKLNITVPVAATTTPPPNLDSILAGGVWRNKNPAEIDAEKDTIAQSMVSNLAIQETVNEIVSILQAASIAVPANVALNIENRIKGKLP